MRKSEAIDFIDNEVKGLFPDWNLTDALRELWIDAAIEFDLEIAEKAIKRHRFESRFNSPNVQQFTLLCKKLRAERREERLKNQPQERYEPTVFVFLKRSEGEILIGNEVVKTYCDLRLGYYEPVIAFKDGKFCTDEEYLVRCAQCTARRKEEVYGGTWAVMRGATDDMMRKRYFEMSRNRQNKAVKAPSLQKNVETLPAGRISEKLATATATEPNSGIAGDAEEDWQPEDPFFFEGDGADIDAENDIPF